ncbi:MAG TPA: choice-of-anchor tandem repeat GloVer-containing protein [Verrucomicrobiae bacterium]|nr:choice-of-anchor tandem repeat GloVer-containing protein [Verrucomicrobiae bacterium]
MLISFTNGVFSAPRSPRETLTLGPDNYLYGATYVGGDGGFGAAFKLSPQGQMTILGSLDGTHTGGAPYGGLTRGTNGLYYGTANFAGPGSSGTLFQVDSNGGLSVLYAFSRENASGNVLTNQDGAWPYGSLSPGPDGYLYGTASGGGKFGGGTVYKISYRGDFTTLYHFAGYGPIGGTNTKGFEPQGGLGRRCRWQPYGTTFLGGTNGDGTVFRITPSGELTTLVNFSGPDRNEPSDSLLAMPDGWLYGTTLNGGIYGNEGTVYRVNTNGPFQQLHSFDFGEGAAPWAGLTAGPNGWFYGTTTAGNGLVYAWGTIFAICTNGQMQILANFAKTNGWDPMAGVTIGPDGNLYGTAWAGGPAGDNGAGVIYRLRIKADPPTLTQIVRTQAGNISIQGSTSAANRLVLQAITNLNASANPRNWSEVDGITSTSGSVEFSDTNTAAPVKFYRLAIL